MDQRVVRTIQVSYSSTDGVSNIRSSGWIPWVNITAINEWSTDIRDFGRLGLSAFPRPTITCLVKPDKIYT